MITSRRRSTRAGQRVASIALVAVLAMVGAPGSAESVPKKGVTRTFIAVGAQATPSALPTSPTPTHDPDVYEFKDSGLQTFHGPWTGTGRFSSVTRFNQRTGEVIAKGTDVFDGVYQDNSGGVLTFSRGTLIFRETFRLNVVTGLLSGTADIIQGDGDPTFRCSSGHFDIFGYINAATGFAGYGGTWVHRCPGSSQ